MTEPTGSELGMFFWANIKVITLISLAILVVGLALTIVIMSQYPTSKKEWAYTLIGTVAGSFAGGATVIMYFNIQHWANDWFGLVALIGVIFICGLPGNAIIRWIFAFLDAKRSANIIEVIAVVAGAIKDVKSAGNNDNPKDGN